MEQKSYKFHLGLFSTLYQELLFVSHLLFEAYFCFKQDYPNLTLAKANSRLISNRFSFTFSSFCSHSHSFLAIFSSFFTQLLRNSFYFSRRCSFWLSLTSLSLLYSLTSFEQQSSYLLFCSMALSLFPRSYRSEYDLYSYFLRLLMICFLDLTSCSNSLFFYSNSIFQMRLISMLFSFSYLIMVISFLSLVFQSIIFFSSSSTLLLLSCCCSSRICFYLRIFQWSGGGSLVWFLSLESVSMRYLSVRADSFLLYSPSYSRSRSTSAIHCFSIMHFS